MWVVHATEENLDPQRFHGLEPWKMLVSAKTTTEILGDKEIRETKVTDVSAWEIYIDTGVVDENSN